MQAGIYQLSNGLTSSQNNLNEQLNIPPKTLNKNKYIELDNSTAFDLENLKKQTTTYSGYYKLLNNNELFKAAKQQFLFDIEQLQELSYIYVDAHYQRNIANFYERIKTPPTYELNGQFELYINTRKHIHCLVQKLIEAQTRQQDNHVFQSSKETTINDNFLIYMLINALEGLANPLVEAHDHLKNVYNSLTLSESNDFTSYIYQAKKRRFYEAIESLIVKFQKENIIDIPKEMKTHYFNAFNNLCCEQLNLPFIKDRHAPNNLSDEVISIVREKVHITINNFSILKETVEEYSHNLESILKKHDIPIYDSFPREKISPNIAEEINEKICENINILLKTTKQNRIRIMSLVEVENKKKATLCFSRYKELLMNKLASEFFKSNLDSRVFTTLPSNNESKQCIGSINNSFFWYFSCNFSIRIGENCAFNKDNSMPLQLSHLFSIDFGDWGTDSTIYALLNQALNQTKKTKDIVAFFCNPSVANQLQRLPKYILQTLVEQLNNRMVYDESFKNNLYQSVRDYIKNPQFKWKKNQLKAFSCTPLFKSSKLSATNRMDWLIDTPIFEPILLKLCKKNINIHNIKRSLNYQQISNFLPESIKKIFTAEECENLYIEALESGSEKIHLPEKLIKIYPELANKKNSKGITVLHIAAKIGKVDFIQELLTKKHIRINQMDNNKQTSLHIACRYGNTECVEALLQKNSDATIKNYNGQTALHYACKYGHVKCVEKLLTKINVNAKNNDGNTALDYACKYGHVKCAELLLSCKNINVNEIDNNGRTALYYAWHNRHIECFEKLLADKRLNVNAKNRKGMTLLHYICRYGNVEYLIKLLAHPKVNVHTRDYNGDTALHYACKNGNFECVKELLADENINVNTKNKNGLTSLMFACLNGHLECVKKLLFSDTINVNIKNNYGQTALIMACESDNDNSKCVKELLIYKKIDVNAKDNNGKTALIVACENGNIECIEKLLNSYRVDVNAKDNNGKTALIAACENDNTECIKKLLADKRIDVNAKDNNGKTALISSCKNGTNKCTKELLNDVRVNINIKDNYGFLAFHYACMYSSFEIRKKFLEKNISINERVNNGATPLHLICKISNIASIKQLLTYKTLDINAIDNEGKTAADYAYLNSNYNCIKVLFESNKLSDASKRKYYKIAILRLQGNY